MPAIMLIAVRTLDKDSTVTKTFGKDFSTNVVQTHTFTCGSKQCQSVSRNSAYRHIQCDITYDT